MSSREVFAGNIRRLRKERGLSRTQFAVRLGYRHYEAVAQAERDRSDPGLDTVDRYAAALGVSAACLLRPLEGS